MQIILTEEEYNEHKKGNGNDFDKGCLMIILIVILIIIDIGLLSSIFGLGEDSEKEKYTPNKESVTTVETKPRNNVVLKEDIKIEPSAIDLYMDDDIELQAIPKEPQQAIATEEVDMKEINDNPTKKELRNQRKAERKRQKQENKNKNK